MSRTVIGPGTRVAGPLHGKDDLLIEGTVEGPVTGEAQVTIAQGAVVKGIVRGRDVVLAGRLDFDLIGTATARLAATAELNGNIEAPRVAIDEGAVFDGQVRMKRTATATPAAAPTAPPPAPRAAPGASTPAGPPAPAAAAPPASTLATPAPAATPAPPRSGPREIPILPEIGKRKLTRRDS
jgi:cytoskeletal protein CcmA (bactofilin family)